MESKPLKRMTLKKACVLLIDAAGSKLGGSGCGLPGGHIYSAKRGAELVQAIRVVWKYVYGWEPGGSDLNNVGVPFEYTRDAEVKRRG